MLKKPFKQIGDASIYGNNQERELIQYWELTSKEKEEFTGILNGPENYLYFRYKGVIYLFEDFMRIEKYHPFYKQGFDGFLSDSFFSGILVKVNQEDPYKVKVYTYIT
jgi:hypothetical protein